jgi:hypothetical protein
MRISSCLLYFNEKFKRIIYKWPAAAFYFKKISKSSLDAGKPGRNFTSGQKHEESSGKYRHLGPRNTGPSEELEVEDMFTISIASKSNTLAAPCNSFSNRMSNSAKNA